MKYLSHSAEYKIFFPGFLYFMIYFASQKMRDEGNASHIVQAEHVIKKNASHHKS